MCGIAGVIAFKGLATPLDIEKMRHRGPDGSGEWLSKNGKMWLGHRRLAILDLSVAGAQPMCADGGSHVLSFNGEIYNHREIRQILSPYTPSWRGSSDTETIVAGYGIFGKRIANLLRGMFAIAIYDSARSELVADSGPLGDKAVVLQENGK
jgi:asparagine synthase (glutamine-hydrolysing)